MTSRQIGQRLHRGPHFPTSFLIGVGVVVLIALALAWALTRPAAIPAVQPAEQPVIGRTTVVTGLRYDGIAYRGAPITVRVSSQPVIGRSAMVTGLTYDGVAYRTTTIRMAAPAYLGSYTVSALVYDADLGYHIAPVRVGGR